MPFTADNIIQSATGTANGTSFTATLPSGTTDGSTVLIVAETFGSGGMISSGFTRDHGTTAGSSKGYIFRKSNVAAGENNWSVTGPVSAQPFVWFVLEIAGLHRTATLETNTISVATGTGVTTMASNTTPQSTIYEGIAFCLHAGQNVSSSTVPVWSGYTGDFTEWAQNSRVDGSTATAAALSYNVVKDIGTFQCTATASVAVTADSVVVVYAAAGAKRQPNLDVMCGFEFGTTAGLATGNTANPPVDSQTGTVAVSSTSPRTGTYSLQLTGSASVSNVAWTSTGALSLYTAPSGFVTGQQYVMRVSFYISGSLPGGDVGFCAMDQGNGTTGSGVNVTYRTASQKIGVQVSEATNGTGTEVLSAGTVSANIWYNLDLYVDMANADRGQTYWADWYLNGVAQTRATKTSLTGASVQAITQVRLGWLASATATIRYDDFASSQHPGHFPLGDIGIYPLLVDPAGTVAISGTTANFQTFTSNGTMTAWNATTARGAIDDIPPTISASADGVAQITVAASDYMEFPMQTYAMATNLQAVRGIRWYFPGWAASTTAATIGFRSFDGTAETLLFAAADPNFDNSTTSPAWVCRMHRDLGVATPFVWSQAKLDALTARVGFSTGATPDIGVHAILAELALRAAQEFQIFEQDGVTIYVTLDPDTSNVIAYRLVAPPLVPAWAAYTINASVVNRSATAGTQDLYVVGAEANSVVSNVTGGLS